MTNSGATFTAALKLYEAALLESRVESAMAEARIAKLKAAAELERAGRYDEAKVILDEVRAEQQRAFA